MLPNLPFNSRLFTRADVRCRLSAPVVVAVGDGHELAVGAVYCLLLATRRGGGGGWPPAQPAPPGRRTTVVHRATTHSLTRAAADS